MSGNAHGARVSTIRKRNRRYTQNIIGLWISRRGSKPRNDDARTRRQDMCGTLRTETWAPGSTVNSDATLHPSEDLGQRSHSHHGQEEERRHDDQEQSEVDRERTTGGLQGAHARRQDFLGREYVRDHEHRQDRDEPTYEHDERNGDVEEQRLIVERAGGKRAPVVRGFGRELVQDGGEVVRRRADGGPIHHHEVPGDRDDERQQDGGRVDDEGHGGPLHVGGVDLLPEVLGSPSDHQTGDEDPEDREEQQHRESGADPTRGALREHPEEQVELRDRRYRPDLKIVRADITVHAHDLEGRALAEAEARVDPDRIPIRLRSEAGDGGEGGGPGEAGLAPGGGPGGAVDAGEGGRTPSLAAVQADK